MQRLESLVDKSLPSRCTYYSSCKSTMPHYSAKGKGDETKTESIASFWGVHGQKLLDRTRGEKAGEGGQEAGRHYLAIARIPSNAKFPANVIEFPPGTPSCARLEPTKGPG